MTYPYGPIPILTVLGVGYLGAAHAACLAELGFDVLGVDTDAHQIAELSSGRLPFFEPGLEPLLPPPSGLWAATVYYLLPGSRGLRDGPLHLRRHPATTLRRWCGPASIGRVCVHARPPAGLSLSRGG